MLTDIPVAEKYFLNPLKIINSTDNRLLSGEKIIEVGGTGIMNEVGTMVEDDKVVLVMGVSNDRCLIFLDLTDVECVDIINRAKINYDVKAGHVLAAP